MCSNELKLRMSADITNIKVKSVLYEVGTLSRFQMAADLNTVLADPSNFAR